MRKLIDKLAHRLGYVRWDHTIQGKVEFKAHEQPFVDLTLPGGVRVRGWVDTPIRFDRYNIPPSDIFGSAQ